MESWEVLRQAVENVTVKALANELGVSTALVYKWCQEPSKTNPESSGARNPLDRVRIIYELTRDARIVNWLCAAAGGFFVQNPEIEEGSRDEQLLDSTQQFVEEFGDLLSTVSRSIQNDGRITDDEADLIRQRWEELKSSAERFVVACERGVFSKAR